MERQIAINPGALEEDSRNALDWPLILRALEERTGSAVAREKVRTLTFADTLEEARRRQAETTELRAFLDDGVLIPTGGLRDVRNLLGAVRKGEVLVARDLMVIAETLGACHRLRTFFNEHAERCPSVQAVAVRMHDLQDLAAVLDASFTAAGDLSPETYPAVGELTRRIQGLHQRIQDRLMALLGSDVLAPLAQDRYATMRADRYVVPLKVQARSMDVGIVHDASSSGQTVFVEPRQVVPMNNELKILEADLRRTVRKILANLSARVAEAADLIHDNLTLFADIEVMVARARLSQALDAVPPILSPEPVMDLRRVRHPILVLRGIDVVPNDLSIGDTHQAIILSGPNTGGKTVALKTMGLCALMARAGLHLPADPGSRMGFFRKVLTDIGDRQTVEADLSTFSGHMLTLKAILEALEEDATHTLVLIDEISVGTDPAQGAVLARALLEAFVDKGARVVVTTHYTELKTLPVEDRRFTNARVVYDPEHLKPTFRVETGLPGRSFAFDVAERLGLPNRVVARARGWLERGQRALEDLLGDLEQALSRARDEETMLRRAREALEARKRSYEAALEELEKDKIRFQKEAVADFAREVAAAREKLRGIVREVQRAGGNRLRKAEAARRRVEAVASQVRRLAPAPPSPGTRIPWHKLKPGLRVWVADAGREGTVVAVPDQEGGMVETQVGALRVKVWPEALRRLPREQADRPGAQKPSAAPRADHSAAASPAATPASAEALSHAIQTSSNVLDLRGCRVDEALDRIDQFLDKAALRGDSVVFLIHGHGTGVLKRATREHLERSNYVARFQPGTRYQGGDGVTVVALR